MPTFEFGPSGGPGGNSGITDSDEGFLEAGTRVLQVEVRGGALVDFIQFRHIRSNDTPLNLPPHGGTGGFEQVLNLLPGVEHVIKVSGKYSEFVHSVTIDTDRGQTITAGNPAEGADYAYEAPPGFEIVGVYGRSGTLVDAMGVVLRTM